MNKATAYAWIGAVIGGIVGLVVSMMFGGGMEIVGTLMFRWMEVLYLTPVGAGVVAVVITIVAGRHACYYACAYANKPPFLFFEEI